jgi:hypothetical protein
MYASKYDSTEENAVGLLATYLYQHNQVYAQIDGAFGHITSRLSIAKNLIEHKQMIYYCP